MRYLLDTNACIDIIKRRSERLFTRFQGLRVGEVGISAVTLCELQFGVARSVQPDRNARALTAFLGPVEVLDFPADAGVVYGKLRATLQRNGTPIGNLDLLIAAHALYLGCVLVTNNTREFNRCTGLAVENWFA